GYRGYRLGSSPVYAATVGSLNVCSINYLQSSIVLTGASGGGFDKTGNPTLYLYREDQTPSNLTFTSGNFWGISAINNSPSYNYSLTGASSSGTFNIPAGNGFLYFFRGNKASASLTTETTPGYTPVTVTTATTGTLNQGQVIVSDWYTPASPYLGYTGSGTGTNYTVRGFNFVGNPYASSIDWESYNTTSSTTGIYASNVGITVYELNDVTNNYDVYQKGGIYTNHGTRTIVSGQGFFVLATSSSNPQLIFNETAKTTAQNTGLNLFMTTRGDLAALNNTNIDQHLRLQMVKDTINTDDIYIGFNSSASSKFVGDEDAPYRPGNGQVSISSFSSDSIQLAINKMPLPKLQQQIIPLFVTAKAYGTYGLNMTEIAAVPQLYDVWLMDKFNKDSLDMRHNPSYTFDITTDTNSYGSKRFQLVIRENPALMVHLLNFTATKVQNGAQAVWATENEQNYTNFTVERSTDGGTTFTILGGYPSNAQGTYSFLDKSPANGANMYRLKIEDINGTISYSSIVTVMYGNGASLVKTGIVVYPNPAKSTLNLNIAPGFNSSASAPNSAPSISYSIQIINILGSVVTKATTNQQSWQTDVSKLMPGTYVINVINSSNNSTVGQGTFIKL
ncbi:MAG TPA: T9SS type A sorting domain-containing protein, partial [Mucilaginibacter sp.]|nr:T9SS type A sorting domain-containing protein [Mucilaginibacter sp.]